MGCIVIEKVFDDCCELSVLGGRSLSDVVGCMVKFLLTVPMQRRYNWCGLKGKTKFGDLGIAGVLCSVTIFC